MNTLKVLYLYYDSATHFSISDTIFDTYLVKQCSVYFENRVIETLYHQGVFEGYKMWGVFSHRLIEKVQLHKNLPINHILKNHSQRNYSDNGFKNFCDRIFSAGVEVMSPFSYSPHNIFATHKGGSSNLRGTFIKLLEEMKIENPKRYVEDDYTFPVYGNHCVMKAEIYERYIENYLIPAMKILSPVHLLYKESLAPAYDSLNSHKRVLSPRLTEELGIAHYPKIPFMLERLVNVFIKREEIRYEGY